MATLTTTITYSEPTGSIATTFASPGPQGLPGPQGPAGQTGSAATIVVGTVTTVPAGQPATVTNVGNPNAAVFNFGLPQGVKGDTGNTGATGATGPAGVGVPTGGATGQALVKVSSSNYDTTWATIATGSPAWGQITGLISNQTDLSSALAGKYSASNPSGFITSSYLSGYLTQSSAAATYYPLTNPSGYITSGALTGYATESWVTAAFAPLAHQVPAGGTTGQILAKTSSSDWALGWTTFTPGDRYLTTSTTSLTVSNGAKTLTVAAGLSYSPTQDCTIAYDAGNHMHATVTSYNASTGSLVVDVAQHTGTGTYSAWTVNVGGTVPVQSVAWGDITGTLGDQSDLSTALNDKLDSTTAASTYYLQTNPAGYIGDAPADGTTYGRKDGLWVATGGGSFDGGTITNPLVVQSGTTSNVTVDTAGIYAYDLGSSGSIGTTLDYAGFNNFSGSDYTNIAPGNVQISSGGANIQITSGTITFPDSTYQTTAATNYGFITDAPSDGTIYGRQNGSWVTAGGAPVWGNITGTLSAQSDLDSALGNKYDASNPSGFITDAPNDGQQYARQSAGWAVVAGGGSWSGGAIASPITYGDIYSGPYYETFFNSDSIIVQQYSGSSTISTTISPSQVTVTSANGGSPQTTTVAYTGITFPDSTTQTSAYPGNPPSDGNYYVMKNGTWYQCTVVNMYNQNDGNSYNVLTV